MQVVASLSRTQADSPIRVRPCSQGASPRQARTPTVAAFAHAEGGSVRAPRQPTSATPRTASPRLRVAGSWPILARAARQRATRWCVRAGCSRWHGYGRRGLENRCT